MGKYLELEPPSPSLGVHRFKREVRGVLLCGPEWEGGECEGGSVCLNRCIPRVLSGEMAQSRDVNGMGGGMHSRWMGHRVRACWVEAAGQWAGYREPEAATSMQYSVGAA